VAVPRTRAGLTLNLKDRARQLIARGFHGHSMRGCGLAIPPGRKFCDSCKNYIVKCDKCRNDFHERYLYEWHSHKHPSMQWVCARRLAKLRDEGAHVGEQVAEFKAALQGKVIHSTADMSRIFRDVDPAAVTGFVRKAKMDRVIRLDAESGAIRVDDPSSRELDELSRRFEKCLLFGSTWRPGEEP
jgi:hypothetical protein